MELRKEFTFDSAHYLPHVPPGHKCGRVHGHTYRVEFTFEGSMREREGWVVDFADISAVAKVIHNRLDHQLLNDVRGLENPTAERLCWWLFSFVEHSTDIAAQLARVQVWETPTASAALGRAEYGAMVDSFAALGVESA